MPCLCPCIKPLREMNRWGLNRWVLFVCSLFAPQIDQIRPLLWYLLMSLLFQPVAMTSVYSSGDKAFKSPLLIVQWSCIYVGNVDSTGRWRGVMKPEWKWAELTLKTCDSASCDRLGTEWPKRDPHPLPPPPHTFELASFLNQECSFSLFPDAFLCNQSQFVFVKLPPLNSLTLLPLLCPTRLVRFRLWLKKRGPTYSPFSATLSGWRLWGGTPSTKSLYLKTSIRFVIFHIYCVLSIYMTPWFQGMMFLPL